MASNTATAGMVSSYKNANPDWIKAANKAVRDVAKRRNRFTSDDVLETLERRGVESDNMSALGMVMKNAQAEEIIQACEVDIAPYGVLPAFKRSERPSSHGRAIMIWQSMIYNGTPTKTSKRGK